MSGYGRVKTVLGCSPAPGDPIEIAYAALYLASDESSYVSGAVLPVDAGGRTDTADNSILRVKCVSSIYVRNYPKQLLKKCKIGIWEESFVV